MASGEAVQDAVQVQADYTVRGRDLRQAFAGFARVPMGDAAIWSLSQACAALPPNHMGYAAWITDVAGADCHMADLIRWSKRLAWTAACLKPRMGVRRRKMIEGYTREWGDQAALDGLQLALTGSCTSGVWQAERLGVHRDTYRRLRNFVAGALVLQSSQFEGELRIAVAANRH